MVIKELSLDRVLQMRQRIMYPHQTVEEMRLPADDRGLHLALWVDEKPISVISVFKKEKEWQFRKFATETQWQGKGYGSQLLKYVMEEAERNSVHRIWCNARLSACALYERFGMRKTGNTWKKHGIDFIVMEKIYKKNMEIIPAIDIIDGKCVRLTQGDYEQKKVYNENPLEVALQFQDAGLRRLHLVDLDGAKAKAVKNWKVLEQLAVKTSLAIDFGGGLNTEKDVKIVFDSGARYATVGSFAVRNKEEMQKWLLQFGADKFLLGADVKDRQIAIHGWTENSGIDLFDFIDDYIAKGIQQVFCTDIAKDGKLEGPSTDLYREIVGRYPSLYFIASGGVSSVQDLEELAALPCSAAIVGKAIYENRISLSDLKKFI